MRIVSLYLLILFSHLSFSSDTLVLGDSQDEYFLSPKIEILEDKDKKWTINDVSSKEFIEYFSSPDQEVPINQNLTSAYWVKFTLRDISGQNLDWLLESYDFKIDRLSFYFQDGQGSYKEVISGDMLPYKKKIFHHKNLGFLIPLQKDSAQTFYLRLESKEYVAIYLAIKSIPRYINYALAEYYLLGFYYGIIVLIALLNLVLFFSIKDSAYLFYVLYVISIGILSMTMDGTAFQFLWPDNPEFNKYPSSVASLMMVIFALLYSRSFLLPAGNKRLVNLIICSAILIKVCVFIYRLKFSPHLLWDPLLDWKILLAPLFLGIFVLYKGYKPARYYVAAFTIVSAGFLTFGLMNQGMIPANIFTVYSMNYAEAIEILLLSFALADRVKNFKQEKEKAQTERLVELTQKEKLQQEVIGQLQENEQLRQKVNRELEQKVAERTQELAIANEQLHLYAEEINKMNELLQVDNSNLQHDIKKQAKDRVMLKPLNFEEFKKIYPDDDACYHYLAELKWGKGFSCRKCSAANFIKGKYEYSRRCTKCRYDESVTAHTIFDNQKFSILKAFYIIFLTLERREITEAELSTLLEMRRSTCGDFKRKISGILKDKKKIKNTKDGWGDLVMNPD